MPTAAEQILSKAPMPTPLSSAEIRAQVAEDVRARSLFSACTTEAGYLARLQDLLRRRVVFHESEYRMVKVGPGVRTHVGHAVGGAASSDFGPAGEAPLSEIFKDIGYFFVVCL